MIFLQKNCQHRSASKQAKNNKFFFFFIVLFEFFCYKKKDDLRTYSNSFLSYVDPFLLGFSFMLVISQLYISLKGKEV